jgi:predicted nucleic acid-binding protein
MPGLDTNVLVRWLVEDDSKQIARVQALFESARATQTMLFVPSMVILELERVLRSRYEFDKATVLGRSMRCSRLRNSSSKTNVRSNERCICTAKARPSSRIVFTSANAGWQIEHNC